MIDINKFLESVDKFDDYESRTNFFALSQKLMNNGYETEGLLLILATWNFAVFRYAVKKFDTDSFTELMQKIEPLLQKFYDKDFKTINFDDYREDIENIYTPLSEIKGIQYTGATKLMHLKCPNVFIIWDAYIRGSKPMYHYQEIPAIKNKLIVIKPYGKSAADYFEFLKDMQRTFGNLPFKQDDKTLAKAIDEYNYVNITLPYQQIEKQIRDSKKNK